MSVILVGSAIFLVTGLRSSVSFTPMRADLPRLGVGTTILKSFDLGAGPKGYSQLGLAPSGT